MLLLAVVVTNRLDQSLSMFVTLKSIYGYKKKQNDFTKLQFVSANIANLLSFLEFINTRPYIRPSALRAAAAGMAL